MNNDKLIFEEEYSLGIVNDTSPLFTDSLEGNNVGVRDPIGGNVPTSNPVTVSPTGDIRSSASVSYDQGVGWWMGFDHGIPKVFIGDSDGQKFIWDGDSLEITGDINITGGTLTGFVIRTSDTGDRVEMGGDIDGDVNNIAIYEGGDLAMYLGATDGIVGISMINPGGVADGGTVIAVTGNQEFSIANNSSNDPATNEMSQVVLLGTGMGSALLGVARINNYPSPPSPVSMNLGSSPLPWNNLYLNGGISLSGTYLLRGSGSPEGSVTAPMGSLYLNSGGGAGTSLYVKESGAGNTGWVGK